MIPCPLDESFGEPRQDARPTIRPLTAAHMYERLKRMSIEHRLNLSAEELLTSAFMGPNITYRAHASMERNDEPNGRDGRLSPYE